MTTNEISKPTSVDDIVHLYRQTSGVSSAHLNVEA